MLVVQRKVQPTSLKCIIDLKWLDTDGGNHAGKISTLALGKKLRAGLYCELTDAELAIPRVNILLYDTHSQSYFADEARAEDGKLRLMKTVVGI